MLSVEPTGDSGSTKYSIPINIDYKIIEPEVIVEDNTEGGNARTVGEKEEVSRKVAPEKTNFQFKGKTFDFTEKIDEDLSSYGNENKTCRNIRRIRKFCA